LPNVLVRELTDGADVDLVLLVREAEVRTRRDGAEFLRLTIGDRTGAVTAMIWDGVAEACATARAGEPVRVVGRYTRHPRYGAQITVRALHQPADGSVSLSDLMDGPPRSAAQMEADLRELLATVRDPYLHALLERVFDERSPLWERFRDAPAAKHYHQAYRHGLLEHSLTVAQAVSAISATFPGIDRDVAVTGALLHDIGKLDAYTTDPACIDLSDAGRLQGEIPLGYYRVRRLCEDIDGFPPALTEAVTHIILSHHGTLEHGSPVVPCTREATLVHHVDNLGGRLGSFDRLEKELAEGAQWSAYDRALGGGAYFAQRPAVEADDEAGDEAGDLGEAQGRLVA
jgi:3'-5' exoribonuclease